MVATFCIEIVLAAYTIWRYKMNDLTRLFTLTLICLAGFQLSEYHVCTGYGAAAVPWSRAGFVLITALPALGIHVQHKLAGIRDRKLVYTAYATMTAFMVTFLSYHAAFIGHQCTGNYVIFQLGPTLGGLYGLYYYAWLFIGIAIGGYWANQLMRKGKRFRNQVLSLRGMIIGYLVFLVPVATAMTVKPETRRGIPSIMCGFAVIFALIITLYILPRSGEEKEHVSAKGKST